MVLFPLDLPVSEQITALPAWKAVEERQRANSARYLLIRQPLHARVSGDIARAMTAPGLPALSEDVVHCIGLHDQGWHAFDEQISVRNGRPASFIDIAPSRFLVAWEDSIRTAQQISPIAGYIVSSHFRQLAEFRLRTMPDPPEIYEPLDDFASRERLREQRLLAADGRSAAAAEKLISVLQFCDLLSLYLCCGAAGTAEFPQALFDNADLRVIIRKVADFEFALTPTPLQGTLELQAEAAGYPESQPGATLRWKLR